MGSFITCSRYKVHLVGWIISKHTCKLDSVHNREETYDFAKISFISNLCLKIENIFFERDFNAGTEQVQAEIPPQVLKMI